MSATAPAALTAAALLAAAVFAPAAATTSGTTSATVAKPAATRYVDACLTNEGVCFKVPSSWKVTRSVFSDAESGVRSQNIDISSPWTPDLMWAQAASGGGVGGDCEPQRDGFVRVLKATKTAATDGKGRPVFAVAIVTRYDGEYTAQQFLTSERALSTVGKKPSCTGELPDLVTGKKTDFILATDGRTVGPFKTESAATAYVSDVSHRMVFNVLASAHR